jgi:hypothetical protein
MRKVTLALSAVLLLAAGYVLAQVREPERQLHVFNMPDGTTVTTTASPTTIPAANEPVPINNQLALRVEGRHDGRVVGTLVVKVGDQWVDVQLASANMRLKAR